LEREKKVRYFLNRPHIRKAAIETLNSLYVKTLNGVFAQHLLATAKQQSGQSIDGFMQVLNSLAKDCTADQYHKGMIPNAFINVLSSNIISKPRIISRCNLVCSLFVQNLVCSAEARHFINESTDWNI